MNLTPKQLRILQLIRDHRIAFGYSPTMQELADELGVSKVTVFEHVEALIKKGALKREPNKARSLSIADNTIIPDESGPL
ncbi:MAG: LexA family protein, partial [Planctomycetota bacterium]